MHYLLNNFIHEEFIGIAEPQSLDVDGLSVVPLSVSCERLVLRWRTNFWFGCDGLSGYWSFEWSAKETSRQKLLKQPTACIASNHKYSLMWWMRFGMWQIDDFSYQKDSFVSWYQHCTCTMGESTRTPWRKDSTRSSWPINVHQSQAKKLRVLGKRVRVLTLSTECWKKLLTMTLMPTGLLRWIDRSFIWLPACAVSFSYQAYFQESELSLHQICWKKQLMIYQYPMQVQRNYNPGQNIGQEWIFNSLPHYKCCLR